MLDSTHILAQADPTAMAMWSFQALLGVCTLINAITARRNSAATADLAIQTAKLNRVEDDRNRRVDTLEEKLHKANEAKIDIGLADIRHKLNGHAQGLTSAMDKLALNVRESEKRIGAAEMELVKTTANLRDNLRECSPSRDEHEDLKDTVRDLAKTVSIVAEKNREGITLDDLRKVIREAGRP